MPILKAKAKQSAIRRILRAISHALFRRAPIAVDQYRPAKAGPSRVNTTGKRLFTAMVCLEYLDAERERRNDARFGNTIEERIIWGELIESELQQVDEQVSRICGTPVGRCSPAPAESNTSLRKEFLMNATSYKPLNLNGEELAVLAELLECERGKLLIEIRHTHHRAFRDRLRHRLTVVEEMVERCRAH